MKARITLGVVGLMVASMTHGSGVKPIEDYRNAGAGPFTQSAGRSAWIQEHQSSRVGDMRSCASCHGKDLTQPGRHIKTGKPIEPMAPSVNPARLTDPKKVEKWFRRNCRWTLGSLGEIQATEISGYLIENAADQARESRARAFSARSDASDILPRITNTTYFRREHYEIPVRLVRGNSGVGSFSNCQACHRNADAGIYNEHQVVIPGVGKWDD